MIDDLCIYCCIDHWGLESSLIHWLARFWQAPIRCLESWRESSRDLQARTDALPIVYWFVQGLPDADRRRLPVSRMPRHEPPNRPRDVPSTAEFRQAGHRSERPLVLFWLSESRKGHAQRLPRR